MWTRGEKRKGEGEEVWNRGEKRKGEGGSCSISRSIRHTCAPLYVAANLTEHFDPPEWVCSYHVLRGNVIRARNEYSLAADGNRTKPVKTASERALRSRGRGAGRLEARQAHWLTWHHVALFHNCF